MGADVDSTKEPSTMDSTPEHASNATNTTISQKSTSTTSTTPVQPPDTQKPDPTVTEEDYVWLQSYTNEMEELEQVHMTDEELKNLILTQTNTQDTENTETNEFGMSERDIRDLIDIMDEYAPQD